MTTHYWIKVSPTYFNHILTKCDLTKTHTSYISYIKLSYGEPLWRRKFKVYSTGDNLYIKKKGVVYWLQTTGDENLLSNPFDNDPNWIIGSY